MNISYSNFNFGNLATRGAATNIFICDTQAATLDVTQYHYYCISNMGLHGIPYHYVIKTDGTVVNCKPITYIFELYTTLNNDICIAIEGLTSSTDITAAQKTSLVSLADTLLEQETLPYYTVVLLTKLVGGNNPGSKVDWDTLLTSIKTTWIGTSIFRTPLLNIDVSTTASLTAANLFFLQLQKESTLATTAATYTSTTTAYGAETVSISSVKQLALNTSSWPSNMTTGNTSTYVSELKAFLNDEGFITTPDDGTFNTNTYNAVLSYQIINKLPQTGIVDAATITKINYDIANIRTGDLILIKNNIKAVAAVVAAAQAKQSSATSDVVLNKIDAYNINLDTLATQLNSVDSTIVSDLSILTHAIPAWCDKKISLPGYKHCRLIFTQITTGDTVTMPFVVSPSSFSDNRNIQQQMSKTTSGWFVMRMGQQMTTLSITGYLLDTEQIKERQAFVIAYNSYMRDTKDDYFQYENKYSSKFDIEGRVYTGLVQSLSLQKSSVQQFLYQYSITFLVLSETSGYNSWSDILPGDFGKLVAGTESTSATTSSTATVAVASALSTLLTQ